MKGIIKFTFFLFAVFFIAACSRKKNTFLSRNSHAVFAKNNALYNGNLAFELGKEELARDYRDDFWEILPVERMEVEERMILPGANKNPNFNIAEEKATKAIQKHSVYVDGYENNPQIDEAYILLGKARYYDQRFVQAMDAFNFILNKYPTCNSINQAKIWKAKSNIRLNSEEVAIDNLQRMFKQKEVNKDDFADANAIIAQAFINLDSLDGALPYIKAAAETERDNELKGRYTYIKGQIYNELGLKDSANLSFDEVITLNRKSPRIYMINAYIEKARNFDFTNEDRIAFRELLFDLEKDRENRPFLDKIYYQIGEYFQKNDSIDRAIEFYNKSIQAYQNDPKMQSVNYSTLAEIFFDFTEYKIAGAYYDSTLTNLEAGTKQYRLIKKKSDNLVDVIKYEGIVIKNDSILSLVNMSESERLQYFTEYTNHLKVLAVEDSIAKVTQEQEIANNEFFNNKNKGNGPSAGGTFYFYNSSTVAFGRQEFIKRWGNRKLEDNWRLSNKRSKLEDIEEEVEEVVIAENQRYNPETYISQIPSDQKIIDSLTKDRNFAYYQLGLIYKEKFKEYELAIYHLETLLTFNPEERLILPSLYNLHKIFLILEENGLADQYKNEIISVYPESRYAEILRNPNTILATDESSPEYKYKLLYEAFEAYKFQEVIEKCEYYLTIYFGNPIVPKLELLKADAIGRQQGFEPYKKALNYVALNYPNDDAGKEAQNLYATLLPRIENKEFLADEEGKRWKIVYSYNTEDREDAEKLLEELDEAIAWYNNDFMSTSIDYYTPEMIFVAIHGLNTRLGSYRFAERLEENKEFKIKNVAFEISSANYSIVQIHKNLEDYLNTDFTQVGAKEEIKKEETKKKETNNRASKKGSPPQDIKQEQKTKPKNKVTRKKGDSQK